MSYYNTVRSKLNALNDAQLLTVGYRIYAVVSEQCGFDPPTRREYKEMMIEEADEAGDGDPNELRFLLLNYIRNQLDYPYKLDEIVKVHKALRAA